jgi:hypothetical protein
MRRIEHFNDPAAPPANSLVPAASAVVVDEAGRILLQRHEAEELAQEAMPRTHAAWRRVRQHERATARCCGGRCGGFPPGSGSAIVLRFYLDLPEPAALQPHLSSRLISLCCCAVDSRT